jgi:hypothetical protein
MRRCRSAVNGRRLRWTVFVVAMAGLPTSAWAQVEPIRVTYRAYSGCPGESRFREEIEGRTERARWAAENERARTFVVTVTLENEIVRGSLSITSVDGSASRREVTGDTCSEVVSALALITALAIDPSASTTAGMRPSTELPAGPEGKDADASQPRSESTSPIRPEPSTPPPRVSSAAGAKDDSLARPSPSTSSRSTQNAHWAIGAEGLALAGLVPGWGVGAGAFVNVEGTTRGALVPSFRASLFAAATRVQFGSAVGADLSWFVARVEACPLRIARTTEIALFLCAALDAGALRSGGTGLQSNTTDLRPWLAALALGRLTWSLTGRFFVEGGGGLLAPLTPYSFFYKEGASSAPVHQIASLGATFGIDAGYRFP